MALTKVFGTETEYGLYLPDETSRYGGGDIAFALVQWARTVLNAPTVENTPDRLEFFLKREEQPSRSAVDAFIDRLGIRLRLPRDEDEEPDEFASPREPQRRPLTRQEREEELFRIVGLSGSMLPNGARFYVDMGHPEYSTPECTSARELLAWYRAGDLLVDAGRRVLEEQGRGRIEIHKDNSDRAGHSYAAHENYLVMPDTFDELIRSSLRSTVLETFFVTRQVFAGAGKVGCEEEGDWQTYPYQLSQRADFINTRRCEDTTHRRGIINMRDRAYADRSRFRRLHVIVGDANMCDVAFWLKIGITAMVLKMLEDNFPQTAESRLLTPLHDSVAAIRAISHDPTLSQRVAFDDGRYATAVEIQREFYALLSRYFTEVAVPSFEEHALLRTFGQVLGHLEDLPNHFDDLVGTLDWVTKRVLLEELREEGFSWDDRRMRVRDWRYHDVNPEVGLRPFLEEHGYLTRLVSDEEVRRALTNPPESTRAYLRGRCIQQFSHALSGAHWQYLFVRPEGAMTRFSASEIVLDDPLCGNASQVRGALDTAQDPEELLTLLVAAGVPISGEGEDRNARTHFRSRE